MVSDTGLQGSSNTPYPTSAREGVWIWIKSRMLSGYLGSGRGWLDVEGGAGGETLE